ncbi:iron-sulfur cluster assembly scaffold protein [Candidatus Woesearchaeota archaeon]|nr:iron-sulfur cluster assembly scaffold protein [Candidatus Woesearchaeota archaeon]
MESETDAMYREFILELYREPHNFGTLAQPTHEYHAFNPLCGDDITLQIDVKGQKVKDVRFEGSGCALCIASASLLTDHIKGKTLAEVRGITSKETIGFLGIPIGAVRMKCALLPLEAIHVAINKDKAKSISKSDKVTNRGE